jgi:hypothetical protein
MIKIKFKELYQKYKNKNIIVPDTDQNKRSEVD